MRCFLGVKLSKEIVSEVAKAREKFEKIDADIKTVENENLHLTVKFLGKTDEKDLHKIDILNDTLEEFDPFMIKLKDVGVFPSADYIKTIWVGIDKGNEMFVELIKNIEDSLAKIGFESSKNSPVPHATIARVKSGKNKDMIKNTLEELHNRSFGKMKVDRITLFKSKLRPIGPTYEKIKEYRL